jgi:hypothetical protein
MIKIISTFPAGVPVHIFNDLNMLVSNSGGESVVSDEKPCNWHTDENGGYLSECEYYFEISNGTPHENDMNFCPKCGKPLIEIPYKEPDDDEEESALPLCGIKQYSCQHNIEGNQCAATENKPCELPWFIRDCDDVI